MVWYIKKQCVTMDITFTSLHVESEGQVGGENLTLNVVHFSIENASWLPSL
jgi:hypothetical protein